MMQDDGIYALIGYQLKRAQSTLRSHMDDALRPLGLTTPQYSCLEALSRDPGASNSDLARAVFVTRQTMNSVLRSLEERGLLERADKAPSGRALPTKLTTDGEALLAKASKIVRGIERRMIGHLNATQINALHDALGQCADALGDNPLEW